MDATLRTLIGLYEFTTGRRLFALGLTRAAAKARSLKNIVTLCDAAIAHDTQVRQLERRWSSEPNDTEANPAAKRIDVLVDRTLGAIRDGAVAQTQGASTDDPIHAEVESFLKRLFPNGVFAVTSAPYVEELQVVDEIVKLLQGDLAATAKELGLGKLTKRLADLAVQYRDALEAPPPSIVAWGRVRAGRAEGQELMLEVVAAIMGQFHARTEESNEARATLLGPILKQNDAIGAYLRSRRAVDDVNPDTGKEEPAPDGKAGPATPADKPANG
ncbi:Hypothetical protein A7982_04369 [Minicystis rosea]|nr:Hypothetical protein A7982_04369 [Minicystis rosea]